MSNPTNDGGPAFPMGIPASKPEHCAYSQRGMTLRDWFAGLAFQSHLSMPITHTRISEDAITVADVSGACYAWADAMLAARERKEDA